MPDEEYLRLIEPASRGDLKSQRRIAEKLFNGEGVERNVCLAYGWLYVAARGGDAQAQFLLDQLRRAGYLRVAGLE